MTAASVMRQFFKTYCNDQAVATATLDILCVLPLLNPFTLEISIILQSLLVLLVGGLCCIVLTTHHKALLVLPRHLTILIALYVVWALMSLIFNHSLINFFGPSLLRLGVLPLIACVSCGLMLRVIPSARLLTWIYCSTAVVALASLASLRSLNIIGRFGGVFHQADILAVWMGCGLVLGLAMWQLYAERRRILVFSQLLLLATLLLSQTRAIVLLTGLLCLIIVLRSSASTKWRVVTTTAVTACLILLAVFLGQSSQHLFNRQDAAESVSYRADLQSYALRASMHHPLFGYGAGNVSAALNCPSLKSPALQQTCHDGFYFNSSHNIYLDRVLAFGFVGGIAFVLIVIYCLYFGLRSSGIDHYFAYAALVIALYYLTNVTNAPLELLLWVLLLRSFKLPLDEKI